MGSKGRRIRNSRATKDSLSYIRTCLNNNRNKELLFHPPSLSHTAFAIHSQMSGMDSLSEELAS